MSSASPEPSTSASPGSISTKYVPGLELGEQEVDGDVAVDRAAEVGGTDDHGIAGFAQLVEVDDELVQCVGDGEVAEPEATVVTFDEERHRQVLDRHPGLQDVVAVRVERRDHDHQQRRSLPTPTSWASR